MSTTAIKMCGPTIEPPSFLVEENNETTEMQLHEDMGTFFHDPVGFVNYAFDWGYGDLAPFTGLREWQEDYLLTVAKMVTGRNFNRRDAVAPIQIATSSGHGIGKSALTAMIILWIMSTRPFAKGIVTANTSDQLKTKTWAELAKWHKRCITGHWFDCNTGKGNMNLTHIDYPESWRCDAQTCREENSEAFAGLHANTSTPFYIFDEASAVPNSIWEVAMGGLTDGEPMFFVFGNPTRGSGKFFDCFHKMRHRWIHKHIDSRTVEGTNKALIDEWVDDYGEDSDFVRVRVRGIFPRSSSMQFISMELVTEAQKRQPEHDAYSAILVGVDVARFGDDQSVIKTRCGRMTDIVPTRKFRKEIDTMQLCNQIADVCREIGVIGRKVEGIFIEGNGVGGPVIDRLRQMGFKNVYEINPGGPADGKDAKMYFNKRAEMWGETKEWLKGGCISDDEELASELTAIEYGFDEGGSRIQLERVEHIKRRDLPSPDNATALALTFAYPVLSEAQGNDGKQNQHVRPSGKKKKYNPLGRRN